LGGGTGFAKAIRVGKGLLPTSISNLVDTSRDDFSVMSTIRNAYIYGKLAYDATNGLDLSVINTLNTRNIEFYTEISEPLVPNTKSFLEAMGNNG
jgi:hypothetical protein